jgi:succinyl-CoA synthetase beta subunit
MVVEMGYHGDRLLELAKQLERLYRISFDYDAELVEANPLVETTEGEFVAVDARIIIDDNALFRHEDFEQKRLNERRDLSPQEFEALQAGLAYVNINGDIGIVGNGAGLVMATLDMVNLYGGRPANFLDMGGGAPFERVKAALKLILSDPKVKVLFVNILGGITLCDEIARSIIQTREQLKTSKPLVVRLVGTNEAEGKKVLSEAKIPYFENLEEAAKKAVELALKET